MQGTDLQACLGFPAPGGAVPSFTVLHFGEDAWGAEWIRILLDDSTWLECPGFAIDDEESFSSECLPYKGP